MAADAVPAHQSLGYITGVVLLRDTAAKDGMVLEGRTITLEGGYMYCTPASTQKARKQHQCTNCAEQIDTGTTYARWMSVDDGKAYSNKMHIECLHSLIDENGAGFWEYSPFSGERPKGA